MNDSRRRQVAMLKREIYATIERLTIIETAEAESCRRNQSMGQLMMPQPGLESLRDALEGLSDAVNHLGQITEWH